VDYPLVVVAENSHRLANLLAVQCPDRAWVLRSAWTAEICRDALAGRRHAVLVLNCDDLLAAHLLAWVGRFRPDVSTVVVTSSPEAVSGLADAAGAEFLLGADRLDDLGAFVTALAARAIGGGD
jgi:hypothetical protein